LTGNLDIVKLAILKLRKIMTKQVQRLNSRTRVQMLLVSITPLLKSADVLIVRGLAFDEIFLVVFL